MSSQNVTKTDALALVKSRLDLAMPNIDMVAYRGVDTARMVRIALNALRDNPFLLACSPDSIVSCVKKSAELGLEVGGQLGEAYLVPFWDKKSNSKKAQLITGYKGLVKLMLDDPNVLSIDAKNVREGDEFEELGGTSPSLRHRPSYRPHGEVTHSYAIAFMGRHAPPKFVVMARWETDELFERARVSTNEKIWPFSAWMTNGEAMRLKCPIRRLIKTMTLSGRLRDAVELDESTDVETYPRGESRPHKPTLRERLGVVDTTDVSDAEVTDGEAV